MSGMLDLFLKGRSISPIVILLCCLCAAVGSALAAPMNPSPANFATVDTHTETMKAFLAKTPTTSPYPTGKFFTVASLGSDERVALGEDYKVNGIVTLSWAGTTGSSTVKVVRLSDGYTETFTTTGTSVELLAPEIGRNYKWTVTNGGSSSTWYFYTDGAAPRIIPQKLAIVGNCRDMGGWTTADGQYRVRQGVGFRNDHNADFTDYEKLKPFWTDIAGIRTDMDLRDKLGSTQYYCNWTLDGEGHPGRSPYGANGWSVGYWNVLREGDYGAVMNAYSTLISNRAGTSKQAAVKTWTCFADAQYLPIVVHCSQGRDRTGTVAFVLLGALGVSLDDLYTDWALTDYSAPKDFPSKDSETGGSLIVAMYNTLKSDFPDASYPTLQDKCLALLKEMGVTDAQITNLKSYLLEPVEPKLTADPSSRTKIGVPSLSASSVFRKSGTVQKPTVQSSSASSNYTVDYGGGGYESYGKYLVTVTLKDPATTQWSDGTLGPKVLPYCIRHQGNVFSANVLSFIKGDTSPKIRFGVPRYLGEVTCSYTEEQLNDLAPGTYEATFTAKACELATSNTKTCKFTVYPADEKPAYVYEYADLKQAYFKTDYAPALQTDKVEVRMRDQTAGEGYAPFSCSPYPAALTIMKMSGGYLRYHQGAQRADLSLPDTNPWSTETVYKLTAQGKTLTQYDETTKKTYTKSVSKLDSVNPTPGTAYIGCAVEKSANRGAEGTPGYHQPHRLYHVKAWSNDSTLIHEFVPCKTSRGSTMLYDKVTEKLYPFSHVLGQTGTVTLGGAATKLADDPPPVEPPVDPTKYGAADTKATTYTWKGYDGPWAYTTNWTPSADATYGIPNHKTYATADFPVTNTSAFTCTLDQNATVKFALFDSPNMKLVIDNASLTVNERLDTSATWGAYNFGNTLTGNPTIEFRGAKAALIATKYSVRANFGSIDDGATGVCIVRFVVPATGWETTAPIRTGGDSKVIFRYNTRLEIDATALGVPASTKRVKLATSTDGTFTNGTLAVTCAEGASGIVSIAGYDLVLDVTALPTPYHNASTGESYATAQDALDAAKPGECVEVTANPSAPTTIRMKPGVTVDTKGFANVTLAADPWFDVTSASGTAYAIQLNDKATPTIASEDDVPALSISGTTVRLHAKPLCTNLYYGIGISPTPNGDFPVVTWRQLRQGDTLDFTLKDQTDDRRFYRVKVKDL